MLIVVMHVANPQWLLLLCAPLYADLINSVMVAGHLSDKFSVYMHIKIKKTLIAVYLFFCCVHRVMCYCQFFDIFVFTQVLQCFDTVSWLVS